MKRVILLISVSFVCATSGIAQNVAINNDGSLPNASAALDIKSNNKGLLAPRMTTAERTAIASPAKGLLVFDTDTNTFWFFNGTVWTNLSSVNNGFSLPFAATMAIPADVFSITNNGTGTSLYGRNDGGRAGAFENTNTQNNLVNVLEVTSNSAGNIPDDSKGNAALFSITNSNSVAAAVRAKINSIYGNFGAAAIYGESAGTGGAAGVFHASNVNGNGVALKVITEGNGNAILANASKDGNGVETNIDGAGNALYAWVPSFATGRAGKFNIFNDNNTSDVITATTVGNGVAGNFKVDRTTGTSPAVKGEVNSQYANFATAGVYGLSSGTGGYAGLFYASNPNGTGPALEAVVEGQGNAIIASAGSTGDGVRSSIDGTGNAIYGWVPSYSDGKAALFVNYNSSNANTVLTAETHSAGNIAVFRSGTPAANVARINAAGKAFFNGGTQNSGADLAEAFDVTGNIQMYQPGDVLVISADKDRAVEKSAGPYSSLVAGVYATKPGVLLTEENIDSELQGKVPMGVVGVIPTRVCLEGGIIKRGDILVTSSVPGVAMKADPDKIKPGQAIGKALQNFETDAIGKINVLVNVK